MIYILDKICIYSFYRFYYTNLQKTKCQKYINIQNF